MPSRKLNAEEAKVIERIVGCAPTDSPLEKARKGVEAMKLAGFSARDIRKAEKMIEDAIARGVK